MKKNFKSLLYIGIPLILAAAIVVTTFTGKKTAEKKYYEIVNMVLTNQISEYQLNLYSGELVYVKREDGKKYRYIVADPSIFYNDVNDTVMEINEQNREQNPEMTIKQDYKSGSTTSWIMDLLPTVLLVGTIVLFYIF